jgi:hypothetical protein
MGCRISYRRDEFFFFFFWETFIRARVRKTEVTDMPCGRLPDAEYYYPSPQSPFLLNRTSALSVFISSASSAEFKYPIYPQNANSKMLHMQSHPQPPPPPPPPKPQPSHLLFFKTGILISQSILPYAGILPVQRQFLYPFESVETPSPDNYRETQGEGCNKGESEWPVLHEVFEVHA